MKKQMSPKKEMNLYQCCICEEESKDFQVCCGHPMMHIQNEEAVLVDLKNQNRR